jgi:hypothetical protein
VKATEKIQIIIDYITSRKQVGHTYTMLNGAVNNDCLVMVPTRRIGDVLGLGVKAISLNELPKLYGTAKPLVIDNSALEILLQGALDEVNSLRQEIYMLQNHK